MTDDFQGDLDDIAAIEVVPQILDILHKMTGLGFSAVARVTPERWIACAVNDQVGFGLQPGGELKVESTICHEIRQTRDLVVIDDVSANPSWATHHTPLQYGFRSYLSVPIILEDGSFFGTLCALDPNPADVENGRIVGMATLFADLIARHLDGRRNLRLVEQKLKAEVETAQLRDQFIAILAHDIKNPIASIAAGTRMLRRSVEGQAKDVLGLMDQSVARVSNIVDNVLDFARGISGTFAVDKRPGALGGTLEEIIREFEQVHEGRIIERTFDKAPDTIAADHARIAQLFANLLSNALAHGPKDGYVRVGMEKDDQLVRIWVANQGPPIAPEALSRLFLPFSRNPERSEGLGLGLYIASQIAKAHGGTLEVESHEVETRFTLTLPATDSPASPV